MEQEYISNCCSVHIEDYFIDADGNKFARCPKCKDWCSLEEVEE